MVRWLMKMIRGGLNMEFMKIGGRYEVGTTITYTECTMTDGYIAVDGTPIASTAYQYSQKITVKPGDVINLVGTINHSTVISIRVITAYSGSTVVSASGRDTGSATSDSYEVPNGVDGIVITTSKSATEKSVSITRTTAIAKGIATDENGAIHSKHIWETEAVRIADNESLTYGTALVFPSEKLDISEYAFCSLRVASAVDAPIFIRFVSDVSKSSTAWMTKADGEDFVITIPNGNMLRVITPDDVPFLSCMRYLQVRVSTATQSATGAVTIYAMLKR